MTLRTRKPSMTHSKIGRACKERLCGMKMRRICKMRETLSGMIMRE